MRKLILVKHAKPQVIPADPPSTWQLSEEGRASCAALAEQLKALQPALLVSSREIKAKQTADLLAARLGIKCEEADGLHEHERDNVPHLATREFLSLMAMVFKQPHRKVLGNESADRARERFLTAIDRILEVHPEGNIAIITHGTVIALVVEYYTGEDGYQLWRNMGLPSYVVLEVPGFTRID